MTNKFRDEVAEAFVRSLEEQPLTWVQAWSGGRQENPASGTVYKGVNALWLSLTAHVKSYKDTRWMTFNQAKERGYKIRKGAEGTKVEYWMPYSREKHAFIKWSEFEKLTDEEKKECAIQGRFYTVFNGDDIEGLPPRTINRNITDEEVVKKVSEGMGVPINHVDNSPAAYYRPTSDEIYLPALGQFHSQADYAATALHELGHATGHKNRLNRNMTGGFGSEDYAHEELIAEIASVFMSEFISVPLSSTVMDNHKAYVQSWAQAIRKDKNVLFQAIRQATEAADYMIEKGNLTVEHEQKQTQELTQDRTEKDRTGQHTPVAPKPEKRAFSASGKVSSNYIHPDLVKQAAGADVLDILRRAGEPLILKNGDYRSAEHDSLVITEGKGFYWFSHQCGSSSAIDYYMWTHDMNFVDATKKVLDAMNIDYNRENIVAVDNMAPTKRERENIAFALPKRAENDKRAMAYLAKTRHLDPALISQLMRDGSIYQDAEHGNVVFVGRDYEGNVVSAFKRSTLTNPQPGSTRWDEAGSQKDYRLRIENPDSKIVYVFESEIDMLSYLSILPADARTENYISLGGISDRALTAFLEHRDIDVINICTDNDEAGDLAAKAFTEKLQGRYEVNRIASECKDWNEDLCSIAEEISQRYEQTARPVKPKSVKHEVPVAERKEAAVQPKNELFSFSNDKSREITY